MVEWSNTAGSPSSHGMPPPAQAPSSSHAEATPSTLPSHRYGETIDRTAAAEHDPPPHTHRQQEGCTIFRAARLRGRLASTDIRLALLASKPAVPPGTWRTLLPLLPGAYGPGAGRGWTGNHPPPPILKQTRSHDTTGTHKAISLTSFCVCGNSGAGGGGAQQRPCSAGCGACERARARDGAVLGLQASNLSLCLPPPTPDHHHTNDNTPQTV